MEAVTDVVKEQRWAAMAPQMSAAHRVSEHASRPLAGANRSKT